MGFLSQIASSALQFGTSLITGQPAIAAAAGLIGGAGVQAITGPSAGERAAARAGSVGTGGNGVTHRRTIVQTIDNASGDVIKEDIRRGAPFLMKHEIQVAKRVFKTVNKLANRLPKKMQKQSTTSALKDQLVDASLTTAIAHTGHHHGNHGNG